MLCKSLATLALLATAAAQDCPTLSVSTGNALLAAISSLDATVQTLTERVAALESGGGSAGNFACAPGWGGDQCDTDMSAPVVSCPEAVSIAQVDGSDTHTLIAGDVPLPMVADMGPGELTSITVTLSVYDPEDSSDSGGAEVMETWESNGPFTRLFNFDTATTTVSSGSPVFTVPVGTASMFLYEATDAAGNIGTCTTAVTVLDTDECSDGSHTCAADGGICTNTAGSYSCACADNYEGDGYECELVGFDFLAQSSLYGGFERGGEGGDGEVMYIPAGNARWITSDDYSRPIRVTVTMRGHAGECACIQVFPQGDSRHTGYNFGGGWWANRFGAGVNGGIGGHGDAIDVTQDHTYVMELPTDGPVVAYMDGEEYWRTDDGSMTSGRISIGHNCVNVFVSEFLVEPM